MSESIEYTLASAPKSPATVVAVKSEGRPDAIPEAESKEGVRVAWNRAKRDRVILFVDDDPRFLDLCSRRFEGTEYSIVTADCAETALQLLESTKVDIVVSDMCMPGANGAELLHNVQQKYPEVVRIIISGRFDLTDTIAAINQGHVDYYITKPFNDKDLKLTIYKSLLQKERHEAEENRKYQSQENARQRARELGEMVAKTKEKVDSAYNEIVTLIAELTGVDVGHKKQAADLCAQIARAAGESTEFCEQVRVATMFQDISLIGKSSSDLSVDGPERQAYLAHPLRSADLVSHLTPFALGAEMIRCHHERFDGRGFPRKLLGEAIPAGARIMAVVNDYLKIRAETLHHAKAIKIMQGASDRYDPRYLGLLEGLLLEAPAIA